MTPRIVILGGGPSGEHDVSVRSAQAVYEALSPIHPTCKLLTFDSNKLPFEQLDSRRDILFLTTHGTFGEDGALQGLLEAKGFTYTGSDSPASELCFHKQQTRQLAERAGVATAPGIVFAQTPEPLSLYKALGPKLVIKPEADGSSLGLHIIESLSSLASTLKTLTTNTYLAERFIEGRELTCGFLNGESLAPVEIIPKGGVYDFKRKYSSGQTRYECPAKLTPQQDLLARQTTQRLCNAAGVRDFARVDFRLTPEGQLIFLEINTLPGLTATSLLPKSAQGAGLDFTALLGAMLNGARARFVAANALSLA